MTSHTKEATQSVNVRRHNGTISSMSLTMSATFTLAPSFSSSKTAAVCRLWSAAWREVAPFYSTNPRHDPSKAAKLSPCPTISVVVRHSLTRKQQQQSYASSLITQAATAGEIRSLSLLPLARVSTADRIEPVWERSHLAKVDATRRALTNSTSSPDDMIPGNQQLQG